MLVPEKYRHVGNHAKLYCPWCRERTKKVCLDIAVFLSITPGVPAPTRIDSECIQASNYLSIGKKDHYMLCCALLLDRRASPSPHSVSWLHCTLQLNFLSNITDINQHAPACVPELTADDIASSVH